MAMINKNQLGGMRGDVRYKYYQPDSDCLPRFNYSNGAGWRTKNRGKIKWDSKSTNKGKRRRCYL